MKKLFIILAIGVVAVVVWVLYKSTQPFMVQPSPSPGVPLSFKMYPAYTGLKRIRFMAWSPDGQLFVTDMKDLTDNSEGKIYMLSNFNGTTKKFETIHTYLENLRNPNSIAFYEDKNHNEWLYIALTDKLIRYRFAPGDRAPKDLPETIATFPDYGLSYKYGGWHLTRTIAIHDHKLYVSVGSSCNSCEEKPDEVRAEILVMNPDGSDSRPYATGLRNAVGLTFVGSDLWATAMGVDQLGDDMPNELLYNIKAGKNYGWPYCYEYDGKVYPDDSQLWQKNFDCKKVPVAFAEFEAHSAPLGLAPWQNGFLVALHGSGDPSLERGDKIVYVNRSGAVSDFLPAFNNGKTRTIRPADIIKNFDGSSFFFTDDLGGTLYYVGR